MAERIDSRKMTDLLSSLKGFLAGSLIIAALVNPFGIALSALIGLFGLFIFFEAFLSEHRIHVATVVLFTLVGGFIEAFLHVSGHDFFYVIFIVALAILSYLYEYKGVRRFFSRQ